MDSGLIAESGRTRDVRVYPDARAMTKAVAGALVEAVGDAVAGVGRCSIVLAGGTTPRALYHLLGSAYRHAVSWETVHVFWGDERYVPHDDPRSNFRMAKDAWLDRVEIPPDNVHPMPTDSPDPGEAGRTYEAMLRAQFSAAWPRFDLVLLGMGADGHTASLFPGSPALEERDRWVVATRAPTEPAVRLTLTLSALNHAAAVWFLVSGVDKARALSWALSGRAATGLPAACVRPVHGRLIWWVDRAAAALLEETRGSEGLASEA